MKATEKNVDPEGEPTVEEMEGFASRDGEPSTERPASDILREAREEEKRKRESCNEGDDEGE